jgi:phospholipid-binding lipoprotein MlaA
VVLPFFGPSTLQTAIGNAADYYMGPWPYIKDQNINYWVHGVKFTNMRAQLLPADKVVATSFDPYIFVRDAYLQTQTQKIKENEALPKVPPGKTLK